jgi:hypothetical protein
MQKNVFNASLFNYILDKGPTHFNAYKDSLIYNRYIKRIEEKHQFNCKYFQITPKGIMKAKNIIKLKLKEYPIKFNKLIFLWKSRFIDYHKSL